MPRRFLNATLLSAVLVLGTCLAWPAQASAQASLIPRFGVGYVTDPPDLLGGVNAFAMTSLFGGLGIYVDTKWDLKSPAKDNTFISDMTAYQAESQIEGLQPGQEDNSWRSFNVALLRPVTRTLMVYAGGGYAIRKRYQEYRDPSRQLGEFGFFLVEDPRFEKTTVNLMFGGITRLSRLFSFQFGIETAPRGFSVGGLLRLPPR